MHHFKPDLINSIDHMRIRVLNPHQWSLAKQSSFKSWKVVSQKYQNKQKQKGIMV